MKVSKILNRVAANAMIWAAIIIASSLLTVDSGQSQTMLFLLIAGWFATQSLITGPRQSARAECAIYRRLLRRKPR